MNPHPRAVVGAVLRDGPAAVRQRRHLRWLWKVPLGVSRLASCWNVLVMLVEVQMGSWTPGERAGGPGGREQRSYCHQHIREVDGRGEGRRGAWSLQL